MILIPGIINKREILYLDIINDLEKLKVAELANWILFVIEDNKNNPILSSFAEMCIKKEVLYVCAAGKACSEIDDLFDMIMVMKEINKERLPLWMTSPEDVLMTTWHHQLEEGFWFATSLADHDELPIQTVLVVNLTNNNYLPVIQDLTKKIIDGWVPSD